MTRNNVFHPETRGQKAAAQARAEALQILIERHAEEYDELRAAARRRRGLLEYPAPEYVRVLLAREREKAE